MKKTLLLFLALLFCGTAYAQSNDSLVVLFLSQPGVRPAGFWGSETVNEVSRFDASGDGRPDLVMRRDDDQGNLRDILVVDMASLDTLWRVRDVQGTLGLSGTMDLWGFADPFGTGSPQALFHDGRDLRAYDLNPNDLSWSWGASNSGSIRFLGAADFRGEGPDELIIYLTETRQVQVWGLPDQ